MAEDFDPYYIWLGIPPNERPANHYRLLGVPLFEENPSVIESAADRQMAHLRNVQAGKHSALSQRLLNEVAAASVCLLRAPQKARYDQALRAKLGAQAAPATATPQVEPKPVAQVQRPAGGASPGSGSESFWEDLTATRGAKAAAKSSKPQPRAAARPSSRVKQLWPVFLVAGACLLIGVVVVVVKSMGGPADETTEGGVAVRTVAPKTKESLLIFEWPDDSRSGLTLTVDGAKLSGPPTGPWEYHCLPGQHHVIAMRAGFKPIDKMVDAPIDGRRRIADAWLPLATLALNWPVEDRDGAVLNVDGQLLNVGIEQPLSVPVEPGTHTVRITRLGFATFEKNITVAVDQHQDLSIAMQATAATLVVRWPIDDRAGAELRIDGEVRSAAESNAEKQSLPLNPGAHTIVITRPGFKPFSQSVTLDAASRNIITPNWTPLSKPPAATVANSEIGAGVGQPAGLNAPAVAPPAAPAVAHADAAPSSKHPIPSDADQQRVGKQLDGIYKSAHDAAKDLAQAKELCDLALKADDLSERYMLFLKGADFAVEAGDFPLAVQAVDTLDAEFDIVSLDVKEKLLEKFVKAPVTADQITDAVGDAERLIENAIATERYDSANSVATTVGKLLLKKSVDLDFRRDTEKSLGAYRAEIKVLQPQREMAQKAKQTLETKPDDADANSTLGRWLCFYQGDWKAGLPYLAKSGNERLTPVAEQELRTPTDATQKVLLADQWWDIAQKETGSVADSIHLHAGDLYRAALPDLSSVVKKAAVEKRLADVIEIASRIGDTASGKHTGPIVFQRGRWIDVLKLVDLNRDIADGNWTRNGSEIVCTGVGLNTPRLTLPIVLDGGYDLEIDFTRTSGSSFIHPIFFVGRRACGLTLNASTYSGLDAANGNPLEKYYRANYGQTGIQFRVGRKYQTLISVRIGKGGAASIDVGVDGNRLLPHWEGDPNMLGFLGQQVADTKQSAVDVGYGGTVTFSAVRLRMVSGQGHCEALTPAQTPDQNVKLVPVK